MAKSRFTVSAFVALALLSPTAAAADSGSDILERARSWTEAGVGYAAGGTFTNQYGTYRTDCSGFVSMALGLPTSYTTGTLVDVSYPIAKDGLEPGDIINNPAPGASGHVVLFAGWADDARTRYYAYEESPSGGAQLNEIPYPYWPGYGTFTPRRYIGTTSSTPAPRVVPEAPEMPAVDLLRDGQFVSHRGDLYRMAGGAAVPVKSWKDFNGRRPVESLSRTEFAALRAQPADGTVLRTPGGSRGRGETYVIAGGAPVFVPEGSLRLESRSTLVEQATIDMAGSTGVLNDQPADGTVVATENEEFYVFAGGAPIAMTDTYRESLSPRPIATTVPQVALDQAGGLGAWSHVRDFPADNTVIKAGSEVYRIVGGTPVAHVGVRGVPVDPEAIRRAGGSGPWSHLVGISTLS